MRRPLLPALRLWRRNIQLRVVATTLLMSLGVVLLLGFVVIGQVRNGLLDAKEKAAQSQAAGGFAAAQEKADTAGSSRGGQEPAVPERRQEHAEHRHLAEQPRRAARQRRPGRLSIVALGSRNDESPFLGNGRSTTRGPRASGDVDPERDHPGRSAQGAGRAAPARTSATAKVYTATAAAVPAGLIVGKRLNDPSGSPVPAVLPLPASPRRRSRSTWSRARSPPPGVFVVVLLGAIAWLVVRQVVTPVRMAAGIAERLAAGRLQERMKVTGEDDIARLGESFNKMAQNLQLKIQQLEELSRMQRRFVSDVSHELRTPLTTVRMAADVIHEAREDFDPATARSAELLLGQLDRFESLLADLLEISRFDAGAAAWRPSR